MKKRITRVLLAVLVAMSFAFSLCITASAASVGVLIDQDNIFTTEQEDELHEYLEAAARKTGYNFAVVVTDDIGGHTPREYASAQLDSLFGADSNSILLLICNDFDADECYDWIDMTGAAADKYHNKIDDIYDNIYSGLDTSGYYSAVIDFCEYFGVDVEDDTAGFTINLVDHDDVLTVSEENELRRVMQDCADDITCNVGVIITDDLIGMSDYEYSKFFCENSFGAGANSIVLLFNNDRTNMNYVDWIYTYGLATDMYGYRTDEVFDYLYYGFDSDGGDNYYQGIMYFCTYLRNNQEIGDYNDYIDDEDYYYDGGYDPLTGFVIPFIIAVIVAIVVVSTTVSGYKKKKPISAKSYMDTSRTKYHRRDDIYLRETTTHVRISSSSGGGGGSRGGGGGRSRSGGGGGGGRRR